MPQADAPRDPVSPPTPLPEGTILEGRWRLGPERTTDTAGLVVRDVEDARLPARPVIALELSVGSAEPSPALGALVDGLPAACLPIIDLIALPARLIVLHAIPDDLQPLGGSTEPSREERAALLVALADTHDADPDAHLLLSDPALLHLSGHGATLRLCILAAPASDPAHEKTQRADTLSRLVRTLLFGIEPDLPLDVAMRHLPEPVADVLRVPETGGRGHLLAHALGIESAAGPVPLRATPNDRPSEAFLGNAGREKRARRRRTTIELAVLAAAVFALAGVFADLARVNPEPPALLSAEDGAAEEQAGSPPAPEQAARTLPGPRSEAESPENRQLPMARASFHAHLADHGPVPALLGEFPSRFPPLHAHHRVFGDGPVPERIEHYDQGGRFAGYTTFVSTGDGALASRTVHDSHGRPLQRTVLDDHGRSFRMADGLGYPLHEDCDILFTLDDEGRFTSLACTRGGEPATFAGGRVHRVELDYAQQGDALRVVRSGFAASGEQVGLTADVHQVEETLDSSGRLTMLRTLRADGQPVSSSPDMPAVWRIAHDPRERVYSAEGAGGVVAQLPGGMHRAVEVLDSRGRVVEVRFEDEGGAPVHAAGTSIARLLFEHDGRGHVTGVVGMDRRDRAGVDREGVHRAEHVVSAHGTRLRSCHFGLEGPIASPALEGAHCVVMDEGRDGRIVARRAFGVRGLPEVFAGSGAHGEERGFDGRGRVASLATFDPVGRPVRARAGMHVTAWSWNEAGGIERVQFQDVRRRLVETRAGIAGFRFESGEGSEGGPWGMMCAHDERWRRTTMLHGFGRGAACVVRRWDARGVRSLAWVDARGEPVLAELGGPWLQAAHVRFERTGDGRLREQLLLDTDGVTVRARRSCLSDAPCVDARGLGWHGERAEPPYPTPWWPGDPGREELGGELVEPSLWRAPESGTWMDRVPTVDVSWSLSVRVRPGDR